MSLDGWSSLGFGNREVVEEQYEKYLHDKAMVLPSWRALFSQLPAVGQQPPLPKGTTTAQPAGGENDARISDLIRAYRTYGHLSVLVNPLAIEAPSEPEELSLEALGFTSEDLKRSFPTGGLIPQATAPLSTLVGALRATYCSRIGFEYMNSHSLELERWIQEQIEPAAGQMELPIEQKRMILDQLNRSELFELFLHKNFTGQKRFSLEGGETLIPMLDALIDRGAVLGYDDYVLGMAHRGRLNVLSNILEKSHGEIFSEFEEGYISDSFEGSGDVKYHKGFSSELQIRQGHKVRISLTPNPSHLESVYPVVEGQVRAKQVQRGDAAGKDRVLPIIIHGDAALAGQGVVYETMQMYGLNGYSNGGTVHFVVNNQIGFTTLPKDARSTHYCTDLARAFGAPVFHVNAERPEECVYATLLALDLRHRFHCDVFIDLNCYRKFGHNETDEPAFTQPIEYQLIRKKPPIRELYLAHLIHQGVLEREVAKSLEADFERALHEAKSVGKEKKGSFKPKTEKEPRLHMLSPVETGVDQKTLIAVAESFCRIPEGFNLHAKLQQLLKTRMEMVRGESLVDWGMAEHLAFGTLLSEGWHIRLSGQDSRRGTFSHRHAVWMDQATDKKYFPLSKMKEKQGRFDVFNTLLSEYAALAFEFGYSVAYRDSLVVWEAQFGDFCNGGQVVIDQYLTTAEQKWGLHFDLVLLLPHGYEGQGPEHSSARMERFLTLCGQENMYVVNPTTPVQLFHLLRRQLHTPFRKPLVVFSPKGLLRHPACLSAIGEFTKGGFQEILDDPVRGVKAKKLVFCSGRIFYELIAERENRKVSDMAIVRIEQLYPLAQSRLQEIIGTYRSAQRFCWVQEEPSNMGAWTYMGPILEKYLGKGRTLEYIGRERSASTAAGSYALHQREHAAIINALFGS